MEIFDTPDKAELIEKLLITEPRKPFQPKCLFRLPLAGLKQGDKLHAEAAAELTNPYKFNVMLAYMIVLEDKSGKKLWEFTEGQGYNITPSMHHGSLSVSRTRVVPKSFGDCHIALYVWAASSQSNGKMYLEVEQDYGWLSGFLIRAAV